MSLEILNMLIETIDSSREAICIGDDGYGEPECIDVLKTDGKVIRGCCYEHYYRLGHYQTLKSVANHFLYKGDSLDEVLFDLKIGTHLNEW